MNMTRSTRYKCGHRRHNKKYGTNSCRNHSIYLSGFALPAWHKCRREISISALRDQGSNGHLHSAPDEGKWGKSASSSQRWPLPSRIRLMHNSHENQILTLVFLSCSKTKYLLIRCKRSEGNVASKTHGVGIWNNSVVECRMTIRNCSSASLVTSSRFDFYLNLEIQVLHFPQNHNK